MTAVRFEENERRGLEVLEREKKEGPRDLIKERKSGQTRDTDSGGIEMRTLEKVE